MKSSRSNEAPVCDRTDAERVAAIARTRHETADPEDTNFRKLVSDATLAYWKNRERDVRAESRDLQKEIAEAARVFWVQTVDRKREFWADAGAAVLPGILLLSAYFVLLQLESAVLLVHPRRYAIFLALVFSVGGGAVGFLTARTKNRLIHSEVARHSLGSLFAGACIGLAALAVLASAVKQRRDASISRLEELAVLSLQQRQRTGAFLQTAVLSSQVQTNEVTLDRAVYRAVAGPGTFFAEIGPTGGRLVFQGGDREHVFANFNVGKIDQVTEDSFVLTTSDGSRHRIRLGDATIEPTRDSIVAVSIDPSTQVAKAIVPIR